MNLANIGVLDDRASVVNEFEKIFRLEKVGCNIVPCKSVDEALDAIQAENDWHFWVVDLMMPRGEKLTAQETEDNLGTGLQFIRELEKKGVSVAHGILIFSARNVTEDEVSGIACSTEILPKSDHTILDVVLRIKETLAKAA